MNGFRKLQERLTQEGWYVGWNHHCCQSCGWWDVPDEADLSKVLFNHSQDCEYEREICEVCDGDGECESCDDGYVMPDDAPEGLLKSGSFLCYPPEQVEGSMFCFDGDKKGVKNLKEILPIIEECGCSYNWGGTGETRIWIGWKNS